MPTEADLNQALSDEKTALIIQDYLREHPAHKIPDVLGTEGVNRFAPPPEKPPFEWLHGTGEKLTILPPKEAYDSEKVVAYFKSIKKSGVTPTGQRIFISQGPNPVVYELNPMERGLVIYKFKDGVLQIGLTDFLDKSKTVQDILNPKKTSDKILEKFLETDIIYKTPEPVPVSPHWYLSSEKYGYFVIVGEQYQGNQFPMLFCNDSDPRVARPFLGKNPNPALTSWKIPEMRWSSNSSPATALALGINDTGDENIVRVIESTPWSDKIFLEAPLPVHAIFTSEGFDQAVLKGYPISLMVGRNQSFYLSGST